MAEKICEGQNIYEKEIEDALAEPLTAARGTVRIIFRICLTS
jgi:hypothetical protein